MLQKTKAPKPPVSRFVIHIWPNQSYFIWHPSGPGYAGLMWGYTFVDGRIPGAVPGQIAEALKALGCRVEDYLPGMDIEDWNPVESGGFEPKFTTDIHPGAAELDAMAREFPKVLDAVKASSVAEVVADAITPEQAEKAFDDAHAEPEPPAAPAVDYWTWKNPALVDLVKERGLKNIKRNKTALIAALEASD